MFGYLARRLPTAIIVLAVASLLIFSIVRLIPGGPEAALAGPDASPEALEAIRHDLGLDRGFIAQYATWIGSLLTLDFGQSYQVGGSIGDLIAYGLTNTLILTGAALVVALVLAFGLSLAATLWDNRIVNAVLTSVNAAAIALPTFVVGTVLILVFGVRLRWLPAGGTPPDGFTDSLQISAQYLLLPALTLGLPAGAMLARFLTESIRTELRQPYVLTARALGVSHSDIVVRHALRNALPPTLTALGLTVGALLGGAVLVESIFGWPGLGLLTEEGIFSRDYPLVQVLVLLSVAVFVIIQLLADIAHAWLDPRIRLAGE
ncbi:MULTISPECIES: ABC transporter permease [Gordonia]|uniref:ABC transporter permease n=1 Tax=Gordonia TaxID=2053 RepID=UPI00027DE0FC|nr:MULTISPECIES: ABC transporter permease [Gordonia]AFR50686.1 ABC-type dipeptide/oligopeptide/nickel transport systems, permease component [Gordonia sp. KTR9]UPW08635.1 ABC transporter permease [Gordonia terrae]